LTYRFSWEGPNRPSRWEVVEPKIERDAELRQLRSKLDNLRELHLENQRLRGELEAVRTDAEGVWRWQGGGDDLQSLSCPVVVRADKMRELVEELEKLRTLATSVWGAMQRSYRSPVGGGSLTPEVYGAFVESGLLHRWLRP
jgi:hypothetical protein